MTYPGFIPLDLDEMVISWENRTFSNEMKIIPEWKERSRCNETVLSAQKCMKMVENWDEETQLNDIDLQ